MELVGFDTDSYTSKCHFSRKNSLKDYREEDHIKLGVTNTCNYNISTLKIDLNILKIHLVVKSSP